MTTKTIQAATYCRVSSAEQVQGTSLDTQREVTAAEVERRGWTLYGNYSDEGVSGTAASRPALDRLLADVASGHVQAVVVHKTDRLARDELLRLTIMREIKSYGCIFVAMDRPGVDLESDEGELMDGILGTFAAFERKRIARRTRAGLNAAVRQGRWGGGNVAPFGYRIDGVDSDAHLEVDEREAEVVRAAVAMVVDMGLSTLEVAKRLNALGLTPRTAPLWTSQNLRNCLRRGASVWAGVWVFGKSSTGPKGKGTVPEPIVVPIDAILDAERAAALRLHLDGTTLIRGAKGTHPLSGRLRCQCGAAMTGLARSDRATRRYRCRFGRHEPGRQFCDLPSLRADAVDAVVWGEVVGLLSEPDRLLAIAQERLGMLTGAQEVEADALGDAERAVVRTQERLSKAAASCIAQDLDEGTTREVLAELREQHRSAVQHRQMVAAMTAGTAAAKARMETAQELAEVARERLAGADRDLQARVFSLLDVRVTVTGYGEKVALKVEGSVVHDLLLTGVREGVAPGVLASAGG